MKNALIFGGTGMLAGMSKCLLRTPNIQHSLGESTKMARLSQSNEKSDCRAVVLDYQNTEALRMHVCESIRKFGAIDIVIAWIHSTAPDAIPTIFTEICNNQSEPWRFIHIKGSSHHLPSIERKAVTPDNCLYREVQLGFKLEGGISRWLTHNEISNGVIEAIKADANKAVIGTLEPWEKRP